MASEYAVTLGNRKLKLKLSCFICVENMYYYIYTSFCMQCTLECNWCFRRYTSSVLVLFGMFTTVLSFEQIESWNTVMKTSRIYWLAVITIYLQWIEYIVCLNVKLSFCVQGNSGNVFKVLLYLCHH